MGKLIKQRGRLEHTDPPRIPLIMKPAALTFTHPLLFQKPWVISCGMALALSTLIPAQSANNFNTKALPPKAKADKQEKPASSAPKEPGPAITTPSRLVSGEDIETHVASLSAVFSMKARATDPFGQLQDPEARRLVKPSVAKKNPRIQQIQATPFSEIITKIKVTTIMPGEKRFLVGTRPFKQGDRIPLVFRSKTMSIEVISVSSNQIDLRNLESGETAALKINLLPVGMTPGNGKITAPGMIPDNPNAPIDLDLGNP
jgi:hypothetical protein